MGEPEALPLSRLPQTLQQAVEILEQTGAFEDFYVAGSAALALHLDHRDVLGLDLMSATERLQPPLRRDLLGSVLDVDPDAFVETARDGFFFLRLGGAAVRLHYYPYPLLEPTLTVGSLEVGSLLDLGLMKLAAIISRGSRRDFVDLFLLCRHLSLTALLSRSREKFGHVRDFPLQALKGLADRSRLDGQSLPVLREKVSWEAVELWLATEVEHLGRAWLGLPDTIDSEAPA